MRKMICLVLVGLVFGGFATYQSAASNHQHTSGGEPTSGLKLETLLKEQLEGVDGTEVIVSRVTMPPNTSLPKHWHPWEAQDNRFSYVLQ